MYLIVSFLSLWLTGVVAWETPTTHDFGDLELLESYTHTFTFKNVSSDSIRIDNIRPSCGCTIPNWDKKAIAPGTSAEIKVNFRPRTAGYSRKLIKVYISGQRKAEKLYLEAFVIKL